MKTVTVTNVGDEPYHGYDHGVPASHEGLGLSPSVDVEPGQHVNVSEVKAEQLLADHPDWFAVGDAAKVNKPVGKKTIDEMNGKELDSFAEELGIDGWDTKAKVADKRKALGDAVQAKLEAALQPPELEDLDDEQLQAHATELGLEFDADVDRETLIEQIRAAGEST
jgi:hypothetical protein